MIISENQLPSKNEFETLLLSTTNELNDLARSSSTNFTALNGRNFEPFVKEIMTKLSIGTPFENSIELISGQKFPDIIAKKYYGVEVKTTTQNHWKTTGNSVVESTRVEGVDRIFMLFAKLASPIEIRYRPYEDVLSEVVVTHSPRYMIDMNLKKGETIFDKLHIPYDDLRKQDNPIRPIVRYYKSLLKAGEELWWMDDSSIKASNIVIRIWGNLSTKEKQNLKNHAMVYFPELFGNSSDKFSRLAIWLATQQSVICPNIRDLFTAGGRSDFILGDKVFKQLPRVFNNLFNNISDIYAIVMSSPASDLAEFWKINTSESRKFLDWIDLVHDYAIRIQDSKHINFKQILFDLVASKSKL